MSTKVNCYKLEALTKTSDIYFINVYA